MLSMNKIKHRQVISYALSNTAKWEKEKADLKPVYDDLIKQQTTDAEKLSKLQEQRNALRLTIARQRDVVDANTEKLIREQKKENAKSILSTVSRAVDETKNTVVPGVTVFVDEIKTFVTDEIKEWENHEISANQKSLEQLDSSIQQFKAKLAKEESIKRAMISKAGQLNAAIRDTPAFVARLRDTPMSLCKAIQEDINDFINEYEDEHPANQSNNTRIALRQLKSNLEKILNSPNADGDEKVISRAKYADICRLLWANEDYFSQLKSVSAEEKIVQERCFIILNRMHINRDNGLPDELSLGEDHTCERLNKDNNLFNADLNTQVKTENDDYDQAVTVLTSSLEQIEKVKKTLFDAECQKRNLSGRVLKKYEIRAIEDDLLKKSEHYKVVYVASQTGRDLLTYVEQNRKSDIKFCTTVLAQTNLLLTGRLTEPGIEKYGRLMEKAPGLPSTWRKVIGAMGVLLGAATIGLSIFAAVATLGVASPLTILGIKLGASLSVAAATYGIGLGTLAIGEYIFLKGTRRNVSDSIQSVYHAAKVRGNTPYSLFSATSSTATSQKTPARGESGNRYEPLTQLPATAPPSYYS